MVLDDPEDQHVGMAVLLAGSSYVFQDFAFFQEALKDQDADGRLAVAYSTQLSGDDAVDRLREFALLLSLHARIQGFDPGLLSTLLIQWPEQDNGMWYLNGLPKPRREISAIIAGTLRSTRKQYVSTQYWRWSDECWEGNVDRNAFPLILRYVWSVLRPDAWRGLRMLREGLSALTRGEHEIGLALLVASFEALIPTYGKTAVTQQLAGQIGFLTGQNLFKEWFHKLYDIRSRTLHGSDPLEGLQYDPKTTTQNKDKRKQAKREAEKRRCLLLAASRHSEKLKHVFAYCAYQIGLLRPSAAMTLSSDEAIIRPDVRRALSLAMYHVQWQSNSELCEELTREPQYLWLGHFFDPYDGSASNAELLLHGKVLLETLTQWLSNSDKYDERAMAAGCPPLPHTLDDAVSVREGMSLDQLREEFDCLLPRIKVEQVRLLSFLVAVDESTEHEEVERTSYLDELVNSWQDTVRYRMALLPDHIDRESAGD